MSRHIVLLVAILGVAACSSSVTPGGECEPGEVMDCSCDDGTDGTKTCLADGSAYGACECAGECEPGDQMDCTCPDGTAGTKICLADGSGYGACECAGECQPGDEMECTCDDGTAGTKTCNADGTGFSECVCACENCPVALTEAPPAGEFIDAGFGFLDAGDHVTAAMKVLWEEGLRAPKTSEEMSAAMAAKDQALAVIEENLPAVQAELLTALQSIEGDHVGRYHTLVPLIQVAGDSGPILTHFQGIAMRELSAGEQEVTHDPTDTELLRGLAMRMLAHQAKRGSDIAKTHVRRALTSPAVTVRKDAVRLYYQIVKSRRLAQREMRLLMSPEDRHLLYLY